MLILHCKQTYFRNYACAVCGVSMVDMNNVWHQLDEEVSATKMPVEYRNTYVQILCKDCHKVRPLEILSSKDC